MSSNQLEGGPREIYEQSYDAIIPIGTRIVFQDANGGSLRTFRYAKNGATALAAGKLCQSAANGGQTTVQKNLTVVAGAFAGDNSLVITADTDAVVVNNFKDGFLTIYDGSASQGVGQTYQVKSNTVASAGANFTMVIHSYFRVAITAGSATVSLNKHPYDSVVVFPTTATGMPVGVPLIAVTENRHCWLQTWGPCCILASGIWSFGTGLQASRDVAGSIETDNVLHSPPVGYAMNDAADTKYGCAFLQIAS